MTPAALIASGKRALAVETAALTELRAGLGAEFAAACALLLKCKGRVIIVGIGKSGHIARKMAASFASTGTPSFFVHATEAGHGDMGMITTKDLVLMISYSGETSELLQLLPPLKRLGVKLITISGNPRSRLAKAADLSLSVRVAEEACPLHLAPTSSTTATLALGDALLVAVLEARGLTAADFARSHPSGALGRKLLQKVGDIMHRGKEVPKVSPQVMIKRALLEITAKRLGMTLVMAKADKLVGVFTDGDLRRCLNQKLDIHKTAVRQVMTTAFTTIQEDELTTTALKLMEDNKINALPVLSQQGQVVGAVNLHDLLQAKTL